MINRMKGTLNLITINGPILLKKLMHKGIIAICILLFILLLKFINIKATNTVVNAVKTSINYEFSFVDDSKKIFTKAKDMIENSGQLLQVFNLEQVDKYPAPILASVHKKYDKNTNRGIDLKSRGDQEPRVIADGIVKEVVLTDTKGYFVTIQSIGLDHTYGYLSRAYVTMGDTVLAGDLIGYLGTNKDGEKYLRFETIVDGEYKNPLNYIDLE